MVKRRQPILEVIEGAPVLLCVTLIVVALTIFAFVALKAFLYQVAEYPYDSAIRIALIAGFVLIVWGWNWMLERLLGKELAERLVQTTWIPIIALGTILFGFTNTLHYIINFFKSLWSDIF
jgi:hypothetical protein